MKKIIGTVNGTGAALYLGLGGIPSKITLTNVQSASANAILTWTPKNAAMAAARGGQVFQGTGATTFASIALTEAAGIQPYAGEDILTSAAVAYQEPVWMQNGVDPAATTGNTSLGGDMRSRGTGATIMKWIADTSTTGHFDAPINSTVVGVGSKVYILSSQTHREVVAYITVSDGTGTASGAITLDRAVGSGFVTIIRYKYDFGAVPATYTMRKGILVNDTTYINVTNQVFVLECEFADGDDN